MDNPFVGIALAFAGGALIAAANYFVSRAVMRKKKNAFSAVSPLRQLFGVAYLVALYFLADVLPWDATPLLVGGAFGITLPLLFFTPRLVRENDKMNRSDGSNTDEADDNKGE